MKMNTISEELIAIVGIALIILFEVWFRSGSVHYSFILSFYLIMIGVGLWLLNRFIKREERKIKEEAKKEILRELGIRRKRKKRS